LLPNLESSAGCRLPCFAKNNSFLAQLRRIASRNRQVYSVRNFAFDTLP
jgi:hypothetical protein